LATYPIQQRAVPTASTWGKNGYNEQWVNARTEWSWRLLHEAATRMEQKAQSVQGRLPSRLEERVLRQAGRELLLAQSSDWPFMITDGSTDEYARRRLRDHLNRFHYLLDSFEKQQVDLRQ